MRGLECRSRRDRKRRLASASAGVADAAGALATHRGGRRVLHELESERADLELDRLVVVVDDDRDLLDRTYSPMPGSPGIICRSSQALAASSQSVSVSCSPGVRSMRIRYASAASIAIAANTICTLSTPSSVQ